jgi:hypothetical protein
MSILLIVVLVVLFGGGLGFYGHRTWGSGQPYAGPGIGFGTILVLLLVLYLLHII